MKTALLIFLAMISNAVPAFADRMCWEHGTNAVSAASADLLNCDKHIDVSALNTLEDKLTRLSRSEKDYTFAVVKAMNQVYTLYRTELPFGPATKDNACVQKAVGDFENVQLAVLDTLAFCVGN